MENPKKSILSATSELQNENTRLRMCNTELFEALQKLTQSITNFSLPDMSINTFDEVIRCKEIAESAIQKELGNGK